MNDDETEQEQLIAALMEARETAAKKAWDITLALDKARQLVEQLDDNIASEKDRLIDMKLGRIK